MPISVYTDVSKTLSHLFCWLSLTPVLWGLPSEPRGLSGNGMFQTGQLNGRTGLQIWSPSPWWPLTQLPQSPGVALFPLLPGGGWSASQLFCINTYMCMDMCTQRHTPIHAESPAHTYRHVFFLLSTKFNDVLLHLCFLWCPGWSNWTYELCVSFIDLYRFIISLPLSFSLFSSLSLSLSPLSCLLVTDSGKPCDCPLWKSEGPGAKCDFISNVVFVKKTDIRFKNVEVGKSFFFICWEIYQK